MAGGTVGAGRLLDGSVDPTEVTAFCLGALFDFHQLTELLVKHEGGETFAAGSRAGCFGHEVVVYVGSGTVVS